MRKYDVKFLPTGTRYPRKKSWTSNE